MSISSLHVPSHSTLALLRTEEEQVLEILRRDGYISAAEAHDVADRALVVGVPASVVLLTRSLVNRPVLWKAKCEVWGISWADVRKHSASEPLVQAVGVEACVAAGVVPYASTGHSLTLATSVAPSDETAERFFAVLVAAGVIHVDATVRWAGCSDLDIDYVLLKACRADVVWDAAARLTEEHPDQTAATGPAWWNYPVLAILMVIALIALVLRPMETVAVLATMFSLVFMLGSGFKAVAAVAGARAVRRQEIRKLLSLLRFEDSGGQSQTAQRSDIAVRIPDDELPVYTVLVPAYREEAIIAKLIANLEALDYPREKLDVIVLLEEDDELTLNAAKKAKPPGYVRLFVTPHGTPKTKPRACNAGLRFARGEYLVIFDAEDRPDPSQLRDVLAVFAQSSPETVVVQGRLNYFNAGSNMLTRFFALEYAAWFDYMLPGLDALRLPIPLGGTSNHFITEALRGLGGWDAHNVTEDADLGLRATVEGYRVGVVDSTTWEEACSAWRAWIKQRTRWIKGYMVTALVHTRHPVSSFRKLGVRGTFGLIALIAGTPLTFLSLPVAWLLSAILVVHAHITKAPALSEWAIRMSVLSLFLGYSSSIATSAFAMARRRAWWLAPFAVLNPFYWCLHSISAWRALWQLFFTPSVWEKTPHGIDANHQ